MARRLSIAVLAVVLVGSIAFLWRDVGRAAVNPDGPDGTHWFCTKCSSEFALTIGELGEFQRAHEDATPPCPKCGAAETVRAVRCASCFQYVAAPGREARDPSGKRAKPLCPKCGQLLRK